MAGRLLCEDGQLTRVLVICGERLHVVCKEQRVIGLRLGSATNWEHNVGSAEVEKHDGAAIDGRCGVEMFRQLIIPHISIFPKIA